MKFTLQQVKERHDAYKRLGSLRATAELYGVSFQSLGMLFKHHRLPMKEQGGRGSAYRQAEIAGDVVKLSKDYSVREIARRLKASYHTVRNVLAANGLRPARKHKLPPETEQRVCAEYRAASVMALSKKFGISFPSILSILRRNGVKIRPRGAGSHMQAKNG